MKQCIFCKTTTGPFTTREHILPESLGGGDWGVLPDGLVCDQCQNKFGSSVEQQALSQYPFSFLRVFIGIPTKKRKLPWLECREGIVAASPTVEPGVFEYMPAPFFKRATEQGIKTQMRIPAEPLKPDFICRFLLKMGIEVVAEMDKNAVFDQRFDEARAFALSGKKESGWWYLQREDISSAAYYFRHGVTLQEWCENIKLQIQTIEDEAEVFHLKLLYLDILTPLESRIIPPPKDSLPEPEYRIFIV
ncbi:MAG: HNH endonuclease [Chloroflexi bacterium]|nr:HNH endonuclease [Chloroflexota bacterium]